MADLWHYIGNDLQISASGGLLTASGDDFTKQRVLRRLLTAPGDYIWHPGYGAGLPGMVGKPVNANVIQAIILAQMLRESGVARTPAPTITVDASVPGTVTVHAIYTSSITGASQVLNFSVP